MATAPSPSFSLATGNYVGTQSLTLTAEGATDIFYTVDGTEPTHTAGTPSGTTQVYTDAISISATTVISALTYITSDTDSPIVSVAIGIVSAPPSGVNINLSYSQANYLQSVLRQAVQAGYSSQPFTSTESADVLAILDILTGGQ